MDIKEAEKVIERADREYEAAIKEGYDSTVGQNGNDYFDFWVEAASEAAFAYRQKTNDAYNVLLRK